MWRLTELSCAKTVSVSVCVLAVPVVVWFAVVVALAPPVPGVHPDLWVEYLRRFELDDALLELRPAVLRAVLVKYGQVVHVVMIKSVKITHAVNLLVLLKYRLPPTAGFGDVQLPGFFTPVCRFRTWSHHPGYGFVACIEVKISSQWCVCVLLIA